VVANSANVVAQVTRIVMEHSGALFDKDETKHSVVVTLNFITNSDYLPSTGDGGRL